jgi:hypothetical protein
LVRTDEPKVRQPRHSCRSALSGSGNLYAVTELQAQPGDPRDERWNLWDPAYRVYFWRRPYEFGGWASREFEVLGEDVVSVMRWADDNATGEETYTLYAVVEKSEGLGLVHLLGEDPTRNI